MTNLSLISSSVNEILCWRRVMCDGIVRMNHQECYRRHNHRRRRLRNHYCSVESIFEEGEYAEKEKELSATSTFNEMALYGEVQNYATQTRKNCPCLHNKNSGGSYMLLLDLSRSFSRR